MIPRGACSCFLPTTRRKCWLSPPTPRCCLRPRRRWYNRRACSTPPFQPTLYLPLLLRRCRPCPVTILQAVKQAGCKTWQARAFIELVGTLYKLYQQLHTRTRHTRTRQPQEVGGLRPSRVCRIETHRSKSAWCVGGSS